MYSGSLQAGEMIGMDGDGCIVCGVLWDVPAVGRTDNCQFVTSLMKLS